VAALIDTNVLVYRFDSRFPDKQKIATDILRRGILEDSSKVMLCEKPKNFSSSFAILYPNEAIVRQAIRGCAAY